jgi:hypothetical protein
MKRNEERGGIINMFNKSREHDTSKCLMYIFNMNPYYRRSDRNDYAQTADRLGGIHKVHTLVRNVCSVLYCTV